MGELAENQKQNQNSWRNRFLEWKSSNCRDLFLCQLVLWSVQKKAQIQLQLCDNLCSLNNKMNSIVLIIQCCLFRYQEVEIQLRSSTFSAILGMQVWLWKCQLLTTIERYQFVLCLQFLPSLNDWTHNHIVGFCKRDRSTAKVVWNLQVNINNCQSLADYLFVLRFLCGVSETLWANNTTEPFFDLLLICSITLL